MLAGRHRITRGDEFARVIRNGARAGRATLVVHVLLTEGAGGDDPGVVAEAPPRVGFVVGRAVGTAVARNRVARRLRAYARNLVPDLPPGALLVVRAQASAAKAGPELWTDLSGAVHAARRKAEGRSRHRARSEVREGAR